MKQQSIIFSALAASTIAIPTTNDYRSRHNFDWATSKHVIAFGDSYTYVQGTAGHPNYSFIGDAQHLAFTPTDLFSNRIVQNQTATAEGGPNWVERLTACGVAPGLTDPRTCAVQLWDFAYAGANTIDDANFTPRHHNETVALEGQVLQFEKYGDPALIKSGTIKKKEEALVAVWIGINDMNDLSKLQGRNATFAPLYGRVQTRVWELVQKIYNLGYRNFLLMNLPPLDRGPGTPSVNSSMVAEFNGLLEAHAETFREGHWDAKVLLFDVNAVLNGVLDRYEEYGYKNVTDYCPGYNQPDILTDPEKYGCTPLDTYFWYNSGHLTSRTHEIFTKELAKYLTEKSRG